MAVDGYMYFKHYKRNIPKDNSEFLASESTVDLSKNQEPIMKSANFQFATAAKQKTAPNSKSGLFEIEDFSFDIEQTLNIGSQSAGSGAGRVTFNPFQINRKIDISSPTLFEMACSGTPFETVVLGLRKSSGGEHSGQIYLVFVFKLVAVKTISWSYDDESPKEAVSFEYGGLQVHYSVQQSNGDMAPQVAGGWNRVKNVRDTEKDPIV